MSDRDLIIRGLLPSERGDTGAIDSSSHSPAEPDRLDKSRGLPSDEIECLAAKSSDMGRLDEISLIRAIAELSPNSVCSQGRLEALTAELIRLKHSGGTTWQDPTVTVSRRLPASPCIANEIRDRTILVTGGAGCIGKVLIQRLLQYGPRRIVLIRQPSKTSGMLAQGVVHPVHVDIRERDSLATVFAQYRPDVVYHLAAQRLPSLGEIQIVDTISTNVFGTRNVVGLSREFLVRQCLIVSTAKAVNYVPSQVYNQTKKLEEWVALAASVQNGPAYGVIRLTHVLDNSWLLHKVREGIPKGLVALQAPDVSFYAQWAEEAADLLLNVLPLVDTDRARIFSSQDLGWPIHLLDLVLYKIYESGSRAGIYFTGAQPGYEDHIFRGVLDWSAAPRLTPHSVHNALERCIEDPRMAAAGVRASYAPPCDARILAEVLDQLQIEVSRISIGSNQLRAALKRAVSQMALQTFSETSPERLLEIARWGASPSVLRMTDTVVMHHRDTLIPLMPHLLSKLTPQLLLQSGWSADEWNMFLHAVSEIPELNKAVTEWTAAVRNSSTSREAIS